MFGKNDYLNTKVTNVFHKWSQLIFVVFVNSSIRVEKENPALFRLD
ncbi:hypothetical protein CHRY9390_00856 [Chryseobacterium aquaeductus]|uniref:Uncharacterized protein n=1 Tax=Chryseobacterium aquaeductus TaxID=2675056 RepID=A0A9N8MLR4_9FLAO|nr:hypothetical protein CHRY9390_00856 [Chryseobacterium potabilaquae]CAD7801986.1 hypothetical protein CHRY9390_00856 [Chryseobacterium aquaeductus]